MLALKPYPFSKEAIEHSIPDRFERIAEEFPRRVAVRSLELELTYEELKTISDRLARSIRLQAGENRDPVLLLFDHEAGILAAILGVLKSGRPYAVLDPETPPARSSYILHDLHPALMVTHTDHLLKANTLAQGFCPVVNIDQMDGGPAGDGQETLIHPSSLAAIFYTSGTTGQPKGVVRNHQYTLHRIWMETNDYDIRPDDRFSLIHNFSFGASQTDIFDALLNGATLSLYNIKREGMDGLIPWLKEEQITFFHAPSDLFRQFIGMLTASDYFPHMRQVTPSGRLYKNDVEKIRAHVPDDCLLIQRLASTETGMITRLKIDKRTELGTNVIPVGYVVEDREVFLVDEAGQPLGFNRVGEIVVKSRYLASGYWGRPDLTDQRFLPDPEDGERKIFHLGDLGKMRPDGCLELIGRKDSQVKIRGYRVEPGEVEAALLDLEEIREAVVIARESESGVKRLIAYIVPGGPSGITTSRLRKALSEHLPAYMIPSAFIRLEKLPLTERNKLDQDALPDPGRARPELDDLYVAPGNPAETRLAGIWSEVLHIEPIGIHDNYFELGGESLLAAQIVSQASSFFKVSIPLRTLFDHPTISEFARAVEQITGRQTDLPEDHLNEALKKLGY